MYIGAPFVIIFPVEDIKRLQRLAISDRILQHLIWERQRLRTVQPGHRPLSRLLLEGGGNRPISAINMWESLEELDVLIDDDKRQRHDRVSSWVKEGHYSCVSCTISELRTSFHEWSDGPRVTVEAYSPRGTHLATNPFPPGRVPVIRREKHIIYIPCCRLYPNNLLRSLRNIDSPFNRFPLASVAKIFGYQRQKHKMPCRCRLENYILSEGMTTWTTRHRVHTSNGELGKLCKKWVQDCPMRAAE